MSIYVTNVVELQELRDAVDHTPSPQLLIDVSSEKQFLKEITTCWVNNFRISKLSMKPKKILAVCQ